MSSGMLNRGNPDSMSGSVRGRSTGPWRPWPGKVAYNRHRKGNWWRHYRDSPPGAEDLSGFFRGQHSTGRV